MFTMNNRKQPREEVYKKAVLKKETLAQVLFCEYCKICKKAYFEKNL